MGKMIVDPDKLRVIADCTEINDHCGSCTLGAEAINEPELREKFNKIELERNRLGYLPANLSDERYALYREMMEIAKEKLDPDSYNEFYNCF